MTWAGLLFATLASLIHVYIFVLESLRWSDPKTMATFGITEATVDATKPLAYNQGFYNLFLATMGLLGVGLHLAGEETVGVTLALAGTASMALAGLVLITSSPDKARAALIQMVPAALAVICLVWGVVG